MNTATKEKLTGHELIRAHTAFIKGWTAEEAWTKYSDNKLSAVFDIDRASYNKWLAEATAWQAESIAA